MFLSFLFDVLLLLGGYGFARLQLRGRLGLAKDAIEDAEAEIAAVRYRELQREREIREWQERVTEEFSLKQSTPRCPDGYSAKQVLGYRNVGALPHPAQYEGGLEAWDTAHGVESGGEKW